MNSRHESRTGWGFERLLRRRLICHQGAKVALSDLAAFSVIPSEAEGFARNDLAGRYWLAAKETSSP
jgi:hypothetical protein